MVHEVQITLSNLVNGTITIEHSEQVSRYIYLLIGVFLGTVAQWVVIAQSKELRDEKYSNSYVAKIVSGGLASLAVGLFMLDWYVDTDISLIQFRLWFAMLIAGFGGMGLLQLIYDKFVKKVVETEKEI